ncbi:MAG: M24 family metallopeptidase C-terminal domain-containing protein, partial [Rhizobiales bacterium]|nr:M24 family metallopeptidase C-terminal domain-containing protein [Hyphomicrobiales bacterium]
DVLGFETLTLVPIDRRLIVKELLTPYEVRWIDTYHASVAALIGPEVDPPTLRWLETAIKPL